MGQVIQSERFILLWSFLPIYLCRFVLAGVLCVSCLLSPVSGLANERPSLFRGVVVADSPLGVRVVSVEEASQAHLADLRPEDIIVRAHNREVDSIDGFAVLSKALKGRVISTTLLIFRNGHPRELSLHLYSYPIVRGWGIRFMPEHDVRFAESRVGLDYWSRLGRGFEGAGKPARALDAYLNGLHNVPTDTAVALNASRMLSQVSQRHLEDGELVKGIAQLRRALVLLAHLFDYSLTDDQLRAVRTQLHGALQSLRDATARARSEQGV